MNNETRELVSSKVKQQSDILKTLKSGFRAIDMIVPVLIIIIGVWAQRNQHQEVIWYVLFAVTLNIVALVKGVHKRIDAVVEMIGNEEIQEKFSRDLQDVAKKYSVTNDKRNA